MILNDGWQLVSHSQNKAKSWCCISWDKLQQNTTVKALKPATIVIKKHQHNVLEALVATSFSYSGPIEVEHNNRTCLKIKGWNTKAQSRNILSVLTFTHCITLIENHYNPWTHFGKSLWGKRELCLEVRGLAWRAILFKKHRRWNPFKGYLEDVPCSDSIRKQAMKLECYST